jgi:PII-like signaling protein
LSEPAIKLTSYFDERDRTGGRFLADVLFDIYETHGMRTSVLLRGVHGFGGHHELHSDRLLTMSESLPAVSIAADIPDRIEAAVREVLATAHHGLITLERARLLAPLEGSVPSFEDHALKLTVYGGRRGLRLAST